MSSTTAPTPLDQAGQALRQVLLRLDRYAKSRVQHLDPSAPHAAATMRHVGDLDALMRAVQQYEQAVTACLPPPLAEATRPPAELQAEREASPLYRLGYAEGYRRGLALGQQAPEQALRLYAQYSPLPPPPAPPAEYVALVQRVRQHLALLTQRYGAGPIPRHQPPSRPHGTI